MGSVHQVFVRFRRKYTQYFLTRTKKQLKFINRWEKEAHLQTSKHKKVSFIGNKM